MWLNMWALRIDNEKGDQNKMYTQISFLTYTDLTYHYHLMYLFVYKAVMDMIHKDGSWIFVPSADPPPASYSAPRCLKALSTLEWLAIKNRPEMANENGENPPKNIDQTESSKKLRDGLKFAEYQLCQNTL